MHEEEPQVLYSYKEDEKQEEPIKVNPDRLAELESELNSSEEPAVVEIPAEQVTVQTDPVVADEVKVAVEEEPQVVTPEEDDLLLILTGGKPLDIDDVVPEDPFALDFTSDISKDEEEFSKFQDSKIGAVDYLQELAKQLGIDDEIEVISVEQPEIPEVSPIEVVADTSEDFPEPTKDIEATPTVDFTLGDQIEEKPTDTKTEVVIAAEVPSDVEIKPEDVTVTVKAEEPEEKKEECLQESAETELEKSLRKHNEYIQFIQAQIKQDEEALAKTDNEEVKAAIQRRLDNHKKDLEDALPKAVKDDLSVEDLPTPEEVEEPAQTVKESLKEEKIDNVAGNELKIEIKGGDDFSGEKVHKLLKKFEDVFKKHGFEVHVVDKTEENLKEATDEFEKHKAIADKFRTELSEKSPLEEASTAEKKAFENGGKDLDDLIQGKAIARIKDPVARDAAVAAAKAGREDAVAMFTAGDGGRKENQAERAFEKKAASMEKAGFHEGLYPNELEEDICDISLEEADMTDVELATALEEAKKLKEDSKTADEVTAEVKAILANW